MNYYKQETTYTCGPACMRMLLSAIGIHRKERTLARALRANKNTGTHEKNFVQYSHDKLKIEYFSFIGATLEDIKKRLKEYVVMICFRDGEVGHYAVVRKIGTKYITLADPGNGDYYKVELAEFSHKWKDEYFGREKNWAFGIKKVLDNQI